MYSRLNIKDIIDGHKASFLNGKGKFLFLDKMAYGYIPFIISFILILIKIPDDSLKDIFGICLSILIGLFLNILVLLTSNISSEKLKLSSTQKSLRLSLLKETFYNVSYSVLICIKALILLFLMNLIFINSESINFFFYFLFNRDCNFFLQFIFGLYMYFYSIKVFMILYMILKRINKLFISEIEVENIKIADLKRKELDKASK